MRAWLGCVSAAILLVGCGGGGGSAVGDSSNGAGFDTAKSEAQVLFDPVPANPISSAVIPFPFDGLFAGFNDPTLNIPNGSNAPFVTAANLQDGYSTTASIFFDALGFIDFSTIAANLLIVNTATGAVLRPGVDFTIQPSVATALDTSTGAVTPINQQRTRVLIEPLKPLAASTRYLVCFKKGARTLAGAGVTESVMFRILRSATPIAQQTNPLLDSYSAAQKTTLESLRSQIIRPAVAAVAGLAAIPEDQQLLTFSFTTQSINLTLKALAAAAAPRFTQVVNTGQTTAIIGAPGIADIYSGAVQMPYYLANASASATAPLATFFAADTSKPNINPNLPPTDPAQPRFLGQVPCAAFAGGATLPDGQTARPSVSTTICYPVPLKKTDELIPLLVTLPNANSGQSKPANGWPVVIFQHGITRNRGDMLPVAPALAAAGFAVVSIDLPLHGIVPGNTFAALRQAGRERTFDLDLVNNTSSAPGPDGSIDSSGTHFLNLASLITSRDNLRQAASDLLNLSKTVGSINLDGNAETVDLDGSQVRFIGHSLGAIVGVQFMAGDLNTVGAATLANPGGGIAKLLDGSKSFGPVVAAGLAAATPDSSTPLSSRIREGNDNYETFLRFAQTLVDSADPQNLAAAAKANHPLHMIEVLNDTVVPNSTPAGAATASRDLVTLTGFLSGTDPLIATLGLDVIGPLTPPLAATTVRTGAKLAVATVFSTGNHGSILDPTGSASNAATTQEMQRQTVNFLKSNGTCLPTGGNCPAPPAP